MRCGHGRNVAGPRQHLPSLDCALLSLRLLGESNGVQEHSRPQEHSESQTVRRRALRAVLAVTATAIVFPSTASADGELAHPSATPRELRGNRIHPVRRHLRGRDVHRRLPGAVRITAPADHQQGNRTVLVEPPHFAVGLGALDFALGPGLPPGSRIRARGRGLQHDHVRAGSRSSHPRSDRARTCSSTAGSTTRWAHRRRDHRRFRPRAVGRSRSPLDARPCRSTVHDRFLGFLRSRPAPGHVGSG